MRTLHCKYLLPAILFSLTTIGLGGSGIGKSYANEAPANDSQPIRLADQLNTLSGTLASAQDVKHYSFTAVRGQRVIIKPINYSTEWPYVIEYKLNNDWQTKPGPSEYLSPHLTTGQTVELRISRSPGKVIQPGSRFEILFGSAPQLKNSVVSGDAGEFQVQFGKSIAYRSINWRTQVEDSKGHPLSGVTVALEVNADQESGQGHIVSAGTSNRSGMIWKTVTLPDCQGEYAHGPFWIWQNGVRREWMLTYNTGYWFMSPTANEAGGVGSRNGEKVSFVNLCNKHMIR